MAETNLLHFYILMGMACIMTLIVMIASILFTDDEIVESFISAMKELFRKKS